MEKWGVKVYKRCDNSCYKCRQCMEFQRVVEQIDLKERSSYERQREADYELRKGER